MTKTIVFCDLCDRPITGKPRIGIRENGITVASPKTQESVHSEKPKDFCSQDCFAKWLMSLFELV